MCGIIAFYSPKPYPRHAEMIMNAAKELETRGLHAFGVAFVKSGVIFVEKSNVQLPYPVIERAVMSGSLIYHNRYSTSGDYLNPANNQPISSGELCCVVNGVTSMLTKAEYEAKFSVRCETENDAEIILRLLSGGLSAQKLIERKDIGSCAAATIDRNGVVLAFRNNFRPTRLFVGDDFAMISSTSESMFRAVGNVGKPTKPCSVVFLADELAAKSG